MKVANRVVAAMLALVAAPAVAKQPKVGEMAPAAELTLVDGRKVALTDLRGQVVVLNFWATWCGPCRTELPTLDAYYELQKQHGLQVFAITTEDSLPLYRLRKLFAAMHMPAAKRVKGPYSDVTAVPTNYVIDRGGRIRYMKAGVFDLDGLNTVLVPLLKEPAG